MFSFAGISIFLVIFLSLSVCLLTLGFIFKYDLSNGHFKLGKTQTTAILAVCHDIIIALLCMGICMLCMYFDM